MSLLSTAELHRQAMSSYSISLAFSLEVSSWEGWPTGVFKHAFIHTCISLSKQSYLYDFERKYLTKKNQVGEEASPADLDLGLIRRRTSWGLYAWVLVLRCLTVRGRHLVCFFHDKKVMKAHLKSWEEPLQFYLLGLWLVPVSRAYSTQPSPFPLKSLALASGLYCQEILAQWRPTKNIHKFQKTNSESACIQFFRL